MRYSTEGGSRRICSCFTPRTCFMAMTCALLFTLYLWYHLDTIGLTTCTVSELDYEEMAATLRSRFLVPPDYSVPYNLTEKSRFETSQGQVLAVRRLLNHMRNGFFVEAGAYDGETSSNTLTLERELNWTGILLEPNPFNYYILRQRRRKAFISNTFLSPTTCSEEVTFLNADQGGQIVNTRSVGSILTPATCFPLYAYLLALDRRTIDYLSLDVDGQELAVLQSIPWEKVDIKVLSVENIQIPEGKQALRSYMKSLGYTLESEMYIGRAWLGWDDIYIKNSLL